SPSAAASPTSAASAGGSGGTASLLNSRSAWLCCRCRCKASSLGLCIASSSRLRAALDRLGYLPQLAGGLLAQSRRPPSPLPLPPRLAPRLLLGLTLTLDGLPHFRRRTGLLDASHGRAQGFLVIGV